METAQGNQTRIVVAPTDACTYLVPTTDSGAPAGEILECDDPSEAVARIEAAEHPRWVWENTARSYGRLLTEGVGVERCHDLTLVGSILAMRRSDSPTSRDSAPGHSTGPSNAAVDDRLGLFDAQQPPQSRIGASAPPGAG